MFDIMYSESLEAGKKNYIPNKSLIGLSNNILDAQNNHHSDTTLQLEFWQGKEPFDASGLLGHGLSNTKCELKTQHMHRMTQISSFLANII